MHQLTEILGIDLIEVVKLVAVDIKDQRHLVVFESWQNNLRLRIGTACNVTGELFDVRNENDLLLFPACTTNTLTEIDPGAGYWALERPEN